MPREWLEAVEELERSNGLLLIAEEEGLRDALQRRGAAVERIAVLAREAGVPDRGIRTRISAALEAGDSIRRQLVLRRGQIRAEAEQLNRAGALVRRLREDAPPSSRIDCRG